MEDFELKNLYMRAEQTGFKILEAANDYAFQYNTDASTDAVLAYASQKLNIDIQPYHFKSVARKILSGTLFIDSVNDTALIAYNPEMPKNRQTFTKLHELYHYFENINGSSSNQHFSDLLKHKNYSEDELPDEIEANFGASLIFLPSTKLNYMVKDGYSFQTISRMLGMSHPALRNRLRDELYYHCEIPRNLGWKIVYHFENNMAPQELQIILYGKDEQKVEVLNAISNEKIYKKALDLSFELPF